MKTIRELARVGLAVAVMFLPAFAAGVTFTDDPLVAGVTPVKSIHIRELRAAVNAAREQAGLQAASFSDSAAAGTVIRAVHITELRSALGEAYAALDRPPVSYTDSPLNAGMAIKAAHVQELRDSVRVILDGCQAIAVTNPADRIFSVDAAMTQTFTQSGALNGVTFSVASGSLPTGLTLSPSGTLSGTPAESGAFPITVRATDGNGCTGIGSTYELEIVPAPVIMSFVASGPISSNGTIELTGTFSGGTGVIRNNLDSQTIVVTSGSQHAVTPSGDTVYTLAVTNAAGDEVTSSIEYVAPALLRLNEVNANVGGGCDAIELRVIRGGAMNGIRVLERTGSTGELNFTFPSFALEKNAIIVVHMNANSSTCNPSSATAETTETAQQPRMTFTGNYDTAYDFWAADSGLTSTDNVFTVRFSNDIIVDALLVSDSPEPGVISAASEAAAVPVVQQGQWLPAGDYVDNYFRANAVDDLNATGTMIDGPSTSIQRIDNTDDNNKGDWTTGSGAGQSFGLINAGQTPF